MPLPDRLARFNRRGANPVTRSFAGRIPGFAIVIHHGRRTGRRYRTPVNLFRPGGDYAIALTYGRDRDWVRNVLAAGRCEVQTCGRVVPLESPSIVTDERAAIAPAPLRPLLRAMRVTEFMLLREARSTRRASASV